MGDIPSWLENSLKNICFFLLRLNTTKIKTWNVKQDLKFLLKNLMKSIWLLTISWLEVLMETVTKQLCKEKSTKMDLLSPVSSLNTNLWNMTKVFTLKLLELLGKKREAPDLNGNRLITPYSVMDGEKK